MFMCPVGMKVVNTVCEKEGLAPLQIYTQWLSKIVK